MSTQSPDNETKTAEQLIKDALFSIGLKYHFLRIPIANMELAADENVKTVATDGFDIRYNPRWPVSGAALQHLIIHCLCGHLPQPMKTSKPVRDTACDISAEYIRSEMFPYEGADALQMRIRDLLPDYCNPRNADEVYAALMELFEDEFESVAKLVKADDHSLWSCGTEERELQRQSIDGFRPDDEEFYGPRVLTGKYGFAAGSREEKALLRSISKYDFSRYLKRFSTYREEIRINQAEFDFIPYCYGLDRYGNMPMIEPLEYTDSHRVEDLVIAIDTSGSCTLPIVDRFLAEIERILLQRENFFRVMNVHIVQCDARIQSHAVIHSLNEWDLYKKDLSIKGRGGTDFTPVFNLIASEQLKGNLKSLKGLLYFTDGNGIYPKQKPSCETAFVFPSSESLKLSFPEWIIPLCLDMREEN